MKQATANGSCQCGAVTYELYGPSEELHHCHCSLCRKCHASMFGTYATIARELFAITAGAEKLSTHKTTPEVKRHFCSQCGAHIYIDVDWKPDFVWYTPGTIDAGETGHPVDTERHIWVGSKNPRYSICDQLPQFDEFS